MSFSFEPEYPYDLLDAIDALGYKINETKSISWVYSDIAQVQTSGDDKVKRVKELLQKYSETIYKTKTIKELRVLNHETL